MSGGADKAGPPARQILDMNAYSGGAPVAGDTLLARRQRNAGAASVLFYEQPIEMVAARGAWMEAADGTRYLDLYNNVPSVGHSHPAVINAVAQQIAQLNTNTRYLNRVTEDYRERLLATLPPQLDTLALVCTGSEANDLAMRVAMKAAGASGFVVTQTAYHGNTHLVIQASPSAYKHGTPPPFVATVPAPSPANYGADIGSGLAEAVAQAITRLQERGCGFAGFLCDAIFSSDGVFADPPGLLAPTIETVRNAGGIYIADEVQPGFARTGAGFWGFERHGVLPDIVTMGKPMGNGFPIAGMAARADLLSAFCEDFGYFNTFGGNPVAAAAGNAVLDVIAEEGLQSNATKVGAQLLHRLRQLAATAPSITDVRGAGLYIGVDLGDESERPDPALTTRVINGLKDRHVLIGAAGRFGHSLKIRPPLCLTIEEADIFVDALAATLMAE